MSESWRQETENTQLFIDEEHTETLHMLAHLSYTPDLFSPTTLDELSHTGVSMPHGCCPRSKPFSGALFICSELGKSNPSLLLFHLPPAASTFFCPLIKRSTLTRGLSFGVYQLCRGRQIQRRDGNIMWVDTDLLLQLEWNASLICWEVLLPLILAPGGTVNTSDKKCHN